MSTIWSMWVSRTESMSHQNSPRPQISDFSPSDSGENRWVSSLATTGTRIARFDVEHKSLALAGVHFAVQECGDAG